MQTKCSDLIESLDCSVIQGSKLSSLLYIIYTYEVPILFKLLYNQEWIQRNFEEDVKIYKDLDHETINFIDDSNLVISFGDPSEASEYLDRYCKILKRYYTDMKLQLNPDKTTLLVFSKPCLNIRMR